MTSSAVPMGYEYIYIYIHKYNIYIDLIYVYIYTSCDRVPIFDSLDNLLSIVHLHPMPSSSGFLSQSRCCSQLLLLKQLGFHLLFGFENSEHHLGRTRARHEVGPVPWDLLA